MRSLILVFITVLFTGMVPAQDTVLRAGLPAATTVSDSTQLAKPPADTLSAMIRMPDSARHNQYVDTLLKQFAFNAYLFTYHPAKRLRMGSERPSRDSWVLVTIIVLLVFAAALNRLLSKDVYDVVLAFYTKAGLAKLNREDNILTSWAFICLFALFGFTIGLFIYQVTLFNHTTLSFTGFQLFMLCSIGVIAFFIFKIFLLRVLGFIFDIRRIVKEYISVLYLTYFNLAFIFLPLVICFSLFSAALIPSLITFSVIVVVMVLLIQYVRSILNIISNFTFHKIYLFIYLCALEICPVLILIKALNL